jgi:sulfur carrier protein ThiS
MKARVGLYGTQGRDVPGYRHTTGVDVDIADDATVGDLPAHLKIFSVQGAAVSLNGRILDAGAGLTDGSHAKIFQTVHGG